MKPTTISEQMLFNTVRIVTSSGTGTGFFFNFLFPENFSVPVIITNKHVVNNNKKEVVAFQLHLKNGDIPEEKININFNTEWHFHPEQDLCFCFANPLFEQINSIKQKRVFYIPTSEKLIWTEAELGQLSAIEDVVMVGYPIGLWDEKNNLPLFRRGITASHPAFDFNRKNIGVVDMACFPGSSGSPIFILNENGYSEKDGTMNLGAKRLIFLGILFQGPKFDAKGEIVVEDIPTQQKALSVTPTMINLGYYIKAVELLTFKSIIQNILNNIKK